MSKLSWLKYTLLPSFLIFAASDCLLIRPAFADSAIIDTLMPLPANASSQIELWSKDFLQSEQVNPDLAEHVTKQGAVSRVSVPRVQLFLPKASNHKAILVMSGGGYMREELGKEGIPVSTWLAQQDFTVFNLIYRLPDEGWKNHLVPFADGQRALRLIRKNASLYDYQQVGVLGFSAGGHLAGLLSTDWQRQFYTLQDSTDQLSARPDFAALLYPVVSMLPPDNNTRAFKSILGKNPSLDRQKTLSVETWVNNSTPPMFIAHAKNDPIAPVSKSLLLDDKLKAAHVKEDLVIFPSGGHGWGIGKPDTPTMAWASLFLSWVKTF